MRTIPTSSFDSVEALAGAIQGIHAQAAGMLDIRIVQPQGMGRLAAAALAGDREAVQLGILVGRFLQSVHSAPTAAQRQCIACRKPLRPGRYAVAVVLPAADVPEQGLGLAVCDRCGPTPGAAKAATMVALRTIWPKGRPITVTHPDGGRA